MEKSGSRLDAAQLAAVMNADKQILRQIGTVCFNRCVSTYTKEYLNEAEQVCVDRCTNKYDSMLTYLVENNPAMKV